MVRFEVSQLIVAPVNKRPHFGFETLEMVQFGSRLKLLFDLPEIKQWHKLRHFFVHQLILGLIA